MQQDLITIFEYYYFDQLSAHDVFRFRHRLDTDSSFKSAYNSFLDTMKSIKEISMIDKLEFVKGLELKSATY